jgi:cytochrome c553
VRLLLAALGLLAGAAHAQDAERGRALYEARACATCHGAAGISAMAGSPSLAGQHAAFTTLHLVLFREGIRQVPAMQASVRGLTDGQIEDLSAHLARLAPAPPPDRGPRDATRFAEGARLSAGMNCGSCHGPDHAGRDNIPRTAGQREDFLARTLREYRDNIRVGADTQMNGAMHGVTDAQIAAIAHYLAQQ